MLKISNTTKTVLIVLVVGIIISLVVWKCNSKSTPPLTNQVVIHDTIRKTYYLHDTTKGAQILVPQFVTQYDTIRELDTSIHVRVFHDTISLVQHDTVKFTISPAFLTLFPQSPKILLGEFSQNNLSLNLLGIDGQVVTKQYVPDFTKYNYEFSGSELKFYPINKPGNFISKGLNQLTTTSFLSTTYNPFTQGATIKLDYNIMYKKIGLTAWGQVNTDQVPHANVGVGLRVQLK